MSSKKLPLLIALFFCLVSQSHLFAQSYEIFDRDFNLIKRLENEKVQIISESIRIGLSNQEAKLLSPEYRPFISLQAEQIIGYEAPWIITQRAKGKGVFHEYGEKILPASYEDIQTVYTKILAKSGQEYFLYDQVSKSINSIGSFDQASLAKNGQVIAQKGSGFFLPLSPTPEKEYLEITEASENFLISSEASGFALINREGKYIVEPVLDKVQNLGDDFFFALDGSQYMLIKGREVRADIKYTSFHRIEVKDEMILEYIHGKLRRVMKRDGILLDQVGMESVTQVGKFHFNVRLRGEKVGLLGPKGWEVAPKEEIEKILPGSNGFHPALAKGKYGYVNAKGEWIIPPQFDEIGIFGDNLAPVKSGNLWGYINMQGLQVFAFEFAKAGNFEKGKAIVMKEGKVFIADASGQIDYSQGYNRVSRVPEGYFITELDGKFGMLDWDGRLIASPDFDELRRENPNKILVRKENQFGVMDEQGNFQLPLYYKSILFDPGSQSILAEVEPLPVLITEEENPSKKKKRVE